MMKWHCLCGFKLKKGGPSYLGDSHSKVGQILQKCTCQCTAFQMHTSCRFLQILYARSGMRADTHTNTHTHIDNYSRRVWHKKPRDISFVDFLLNLTPWLHILLCVSLTFLTRHKAFGLQHPESLEIFTAKFSFGWKEVHAIFADDHFTEVFLAVCFVRHFGTSWRIVLFFGCLVCF